MSWTDERVETLKRLWGEGHSASQIAGQLGGVSRNAVIGKVHRLGLESRLKKEGVVKDAPAPDGSSAPDVAASDGTVEASSGSAAPETAEASPEPATQAPAPMAGNEAAAEGDAPPVPANDPGTPAPDAAADGEDDVVVPIPLKLKLTQLTERTCKWPIGDPMHDDFHFCGHDAEEGRPYCEYHSGLAFQPASERRRVR